jgi:hypothetical protein
MTGANDLDRALAAYLDEGPTRAPDRPLDAAVGYARAHPRRRDALAVLRPDVMGRRTGPFSPQLAWAVVVLGLVLAGVAAVAIGSRQDSRPVVPPPPSPSALVPSGSPSPVLLSVEVIDSNGGTRTVRISDASATIVDAEPGPPAGGLPVDDIAARNDPADATRVLIAWSYTSCTDPVDVTVDRSGQVIRLERPVCSGDALGGDDLQLTLTFDEPVDAAGLDVALVEVP